MIMLAPNIPPKFAIQLNRLNATASSNALLSWSVLWGEIGANGLS
jgi:hypothetical protein